MRKSNTAILFFSRSLQDEFEVKGMGLSFGRFKHLYQLFVKRTLSTLHQTGLPVFESYSNTQIGQSFGERLTNELRRVKQLGFKSVIVIGNDSPELNSADLNIALDSLKNGSSVLGENHRGGTYLIGFSFDALDLDAFCSLEWQSSNIFDQLFTLLPHAIELEQKFDINSRADFRVVNLYAHLSRGLKRLLMSFFRIFEDSFELGDFHKVPVLIRNEKRGPPQLA